MAGDDLVAGGDHNQSVQLMRLYHDLDGVFDQLAAGQRVSHAFMTHGYAVAHANSLEFKGHSSRGEDACFYSLSQLIEMNMPRDKIIKRVDNSYEGTTDLFIAQAGGL